MTKIDKDKVAVRYGTVKWESRAKIMDAEGKEMDDDAMPLKFGGVAAVVDSVTDMGWFEEVVARGAFDDAISRTDVDIRVLANHREDNLLGRTKAKTARVFVNNAGDLEYEWLPDYENPLHVQWARSIMRGDCTQSSFTFYIESDKWEYKDEQRAKSKRTILKVKEILDVAPVTFPAYEDTTSEARSSLQHYEASLQQQEESADLDLLTIEIIKNKNHA